MSNCKICHAVLHSAREHCPVCGAMVMETIIVDSLTTFEIQIAQSRTVENKIIVAAQGAERVYQSPYMGKAGRRYAIGD
jgi:RNA polymerase subunit RPABC4/transcription elongation factor Spt4